MLIAIGGVIAPKATLAESWQFHGRIVGITDGDTITLLDADKTQHKIRLDGIDAPERGQAFGNRSKQSLADLAHGRHAAADCHKTDRYGRRVCVVTLDGRDAGLEQIRRGMPGCSSPYLKELETDRRRAYLASEGEARAGRRGLWRDA